MRVRVLRKVRRGTVLDLPDAVGQGLVDAGLAVRLAEVVAEGPTVAPAPSPEPEPPLVAEPPEAAVLKAAPERAVPARPRARG